MLQYKFITIVVNTSSGNGIYNSIMLPVGYLLTLNSALARVTVDGSDVYTNIENITVNGFSYRVNSTKIKGTILGIK